MSTPPPAKHEDAPRTPDRWSEFTSTDPVPSPNTFSPVQTGGADVPFADVFAPNVLQGGADASNSSPPHALTADDISLLLESIANPASPNCASITANTCRNRHEHARV